MFPPFTRRHAPDRDDVTRFEVVDEYGTVYQTSHDLSAALNWADGAKIRRKIGGTTRTLYVDEVNPTGRRRVGKAY